MKRIAFALVLAMLCSVSWAQEFTHMGTFGWLPASSDNVCSLVDSLSAIPDAVTLWSATDVRLYIGLRTNASDAAAAQTAVDSLCNHTQVSPAAGQTIHGPVEWLLSPAHSDTIYVACYRLVRPR